MTKNTLNLIKNDAFFEAKMPESLMISAIRGGNEHE